MKTTTQLATMNIDTNVTCKTETIDDVTHVYVINEIVVDNKNFEQRVKVATILSEKTLGEVAEEFGTSLTNFTLRCRTGKMDFAEQRKIAEILGCTAVMQYVFDDGAVYQEKTIKDLVMGALRHVHMTQWELGKCLGYSARQAFSLKLNHGRFNDDDLRRIGTEIGCKYYSYFETKDGTKI